MGMADQGPLLPHQNHSPHSVLEKSDPYWKEMMLARNMMGHPQDQQCLEKTEKIKEKERHESKPEEKQRKSKKERVSNFVRL